MSVVLADVVALAADGADTGAEAFAGIISLALCDGDSIVRRDLVVEPAEVSGEWIRRRRRIDVVIGDHAIYVFSWCIGSREILLDTDSNRIEAAGGNLVTVVVFVGERGAMHHTAHNGRGLRVIDSRKAGEISAEDGSSWN